MRYHTYQTINLLNLLDYEKSKSRGSKIAAQQEKLS